MENWKWRIFCSQALDGIDLFGHDLPKILNVINARHKLSVVLGNNGVHSKEFLGNNFCTRSQWFLFLKFEFLKLKIYLIMKFLNIKYYFKFAFGCQKVHTIHFGLLGPLELSTFLHILDKIWRTFDLWLECKVALALLVFLKCGSL